MMTPELAGDRRLHYQRQYLHVSLWLQRLGVGLAAPIDEFAPGSGQHQVDLLVD